MQDSTPSTALQLYLDERRTDDLADSTLNSHRSRLSIFVEWCEDEGIESMQEVTGLTIHQYRSHRAQEVNTVTLSTQLDTLRVFISFCERLELVEKDLADKIDSVALARGEEARDEMLDTDQARAALEHLRKYEYCSRAHVQMLLAWRLGARLGALRGLDTGDVHAEEGYISIRHRPETDTPLKNRKRGERDAAIRDSTAEVLRDWINEARPEVEDEFGREPLLATAQGRPGRQSVRRAAYAWTRPCVVGLECPHGRVPEDCNATQYENAYECPSSVSPHPIRRGAITHWLREGVDEVTVSGRMDVSPDVIERHYDRRSEREKMETRRRFLDVVGDE